MNAALVPPHHAVLAGPPCTDCGRAFVTKAWASAHGTNEAYTTHAGRGLCQTCRGRRKRAGVEMPPAGGKRLALDVDPEPKRQRLAPPPPPPELQAYLDRRRARLAARARRRAR